MIAAAARTAFSQDPGMGGRRAVLPRRWTVTLTVAADAPAALPAQAPEPRRFAPELQGLLTDDAILHIPDRARAAAQAFDAGNGFVPGQLIDRAI